ncbi:GNAT family N-acetyltransferase [filamentous cyanobacterium LEGE 11480]|uniref:GNAT family N-acetyltransferase n=1 Tax=Romeriopsis navalis LEGE 11480 TaxID=2777977 RepID=A0A928VMK2_9CYAN|nr:GNAT family N-acetyltransferase [Romeriopsis navalis]MBE9030372.1 GNAT family N-acetyltransferase [Romeriopsis navalis LEGE 11480]
MISTERLVLRPLQTSDTSAIAQIYADDRVFEHFGTGVRTLAETAASVDRAVTKWSKTGYGPLAICLAGTVIGRMIIFPNAGVDFELGYVLHPAYWGRRFAQEASRAAVDYVFEQGLTDRVVACARQSNQASRHILSTLGFRVMREEIGDDGIMRIWFELNVQNFQR